MTTYIEVAQALVEPGYLSEADITAAADILADVLVVTDTEISEARAKADEAIQQQLISGATAAQSRDLDVDDLEDFMIEQDIIDDAEEQVLEDEAAIAAAEDTISATYTDAVTALVAAELIDEINAAAVAAVIANVWVVEEL